MNFPILSSIIFLPLVGAFFVFLTRSEKGETNNGATYISIFTSVANFLITLFLWYSFDNQSYEFQFVEEIIWISGFIKFKLGIEGISILFILLTAFITPICIISCINSVKNRLKEFLIALLVLETFMIGVFCSLDLVIFYLFFEAGLIPMFLIIGIWGGPKKVYSAFKFFLYTLLGSVLMLVAIIAIYWITGTTDVTEIYKIKIPPEFQYLLWLAFFSSFAVKLPMWPVHTWLPDAHVEAPTPGSVVLAAITSCTNTSNPYVMVTAGLVAKKAHDLGLKVPSFVKTSLAPGSKVVVDYLENAGLLESLSDIGFKTVGFGCTTCIGNSGPLPDEVANLVTDKELHVAAVSSGNRNFEGRVHPLIRLSYLGSPPLVVAYALAGTVDIDFYREEIGKSKDGKDIFLKDIWPTNQEIKDTVNKSILPDTFINRYRDIFVGDKSWESISIPDGSIYEWSEKSTYIQKPGFFDDFTSELPQIGDIQNAKVLAYLGDSITTDHISPAGSFTEETPAGKYLVDRGVKIKDFNSYGSRRGNHEVMMRGTFANIRIKNKLLDDIEGGFTKYFATGETMSIYDAAIKYKESKTDLIVIAGKEYGTGSSRDWAAKGSMLLGVKAVIAESFERIHRSNLVGMGVLPLQFKENESAESHKITGDEEFSVSGISSGLRPLSNIILNITNDMGDTRQVELICRLDSIVEVDYFYNGGILQTVLRQMQKTN